MGDSHMGLHARLMSQASGGVLTGAVSRCNTCLIFINQVLKRKIGVVVLINPETTTGGFKLSNFIVRSGRRSPLIRGHRRRQIDQTLATASRA